MFQHDWKTFFLHDIILEYKFSLHVKMSKKLNCKKKECNAMLGKDCKFFAKKSTMNSETPLNSHINYWY